MSASQITSRTTMKAAAGLAGVILVVSALAGCGGSSSPVPHNVSASSGATTTAAAALPTPSPSNDDVGSAKAQVKADKKGARSQPSTIAATGSSPGNSSSRSSASASSHTTDRVTRGHHVQHAQSPPSSSDDDQSNTGVRPVDPCRLVTAPEARSITAGGITGVTEAPLGPTCIYHSAKAKSPSITMTVEVMKLAQVTQKLARKAQFTIKSHPAYCGKLGSEMLFVPLTNGQVLNVVAPCSVAREFASVALGRLAA
jgi:hypothetical protein